MAPLKFITPRLPVDAWPESDWEAWEHARASADLFDEDGAAAHWSAPMVRAVEEAVGYWLGWLAKAEPGALILVPATRLTPTRVQAFGRALSEALAPLSVVHRLGHLAEGLRVMYPQADRSCLNTLRHRLKRQARPVRRKEQQMINAMRLVELGEALMREADGMTGKAAADWFRRGLTIAFLAYRPIRVANLAELSLADHLQKRDGRTWVHIPGPQVKNRMPLDFIWPDELTDPLDRYLIRERPVLLSGQPATDRLWIIWEGRLSDSLDHRTRNRGISRTRESLDRWITYPARWIDAQDRWTMWSEDSAAEHLHGAGRVGSSVGRRSALAGGGTAGARDPALGGTVMADGVRGCRCRHCARARAEPHL
jgi:hypothetical protein